MTEFMDGAFCSRYRSTIEDHEKCGKKIYRGCVAYTQSNMLDASRLVTFFVFLASCSSIQVLDTANSRSAANYFPSSLQSGIQGEIPSSSQRPAPRQWGDLPKDDLEESVAAALRFYFELFETAAAVKNEIQKEHIIFLSGDLTVKPTNLSEDVILRPGTSCPLFSDFSVHFKMGSIENSQSQVADLYINIFDEEKLKEAFNYSCARANAMWLRKYPSDVLGTMSRLENAWNQLWVKIDHRSGDVSVHLRDGIDEYSAILFNVPSVLSTYQMRSRNHNMKLKRFSQLTKSDVTACCPHCMQFEAVFALVKMSRQIAADRLTVGWWGRLFTFKEMIGDLYLNQKTIRNIWSRETSIENIKTHRLIEWLPDAKLHAPVGSKLPSKVWILKLSFVRDGVMKIFDSETRSFYDISYEQELPKCLKESPFVTAVDGFWLSCDPSSGSCHAER